MIPKPTIQAGATKQGWHSIADFLRCPKAWQFSKIRGVRLPGTKVPDYFSIGVMFHAGRARWFSIGFQASTKAQDELFAAMEEAAEAEKLPVSAEARQLSQRYILEYVEHWSRRPTPTPKFAEYTLEPTKLVRGDPQFWERTARLDDVSKYPEALGGLCIGEAKTTSNSVADCIQEYTLHGQPLLQLALWERAVNGAPMHGPVDGVMLDVIKKGVGSKRSEFGRHFIPYSRDMVEAFVRSIRGYLKAAERIDWNTEVPRNYKGCTYVSSGRRAVCEFRDLCMAGRDASAKYYVGDEPMRMWMPEPGKETPPWL